jgi:hypothetical protein
MLIYAILCGLFNSLVILYDYDQQLVKTKE